MIEKIFINNSERYNEKVIEYCLNIKALNLLKSNNAIKDELYNKVKKKINDNYNT